MSVEQLMTVQQMETPHSGQGVFELPCGYVDPVTNELYVDVEVREITGYEEDMLASDKIPAEQKMDLLIGSCVTRIGDITEPGPIKQIARNLATGDQVFLLFAIRRVTLGDMMPVREKCPSCGVTSLFQTDLGELEVKPMEDRRKRVFDVALPSGKKARYRTSTGADSLEVQKIIRKSKADSISLMMMMRLEILEDEKPTLEMVKKLGMRDRQALRAAMNESEGGVDTTLELECPSCGHEWEKELNVGAQAFFFPSETPNP